MISNGRNTTETQRPKREPFSIADRYYGSRSGHDPEKLRAFRKKESFIYLRAGLMTLAVVSLTVFIFEPLWPKLLLSAAWIAGMYHTFRSLRKFREEVVRENNEKNPLNPSFNASQ